MFLFVYLVVNEYTIFYYKTIVSSICFEPQMQKFPVSSEISKLIKVLLFIVKLLQMSFSWVQTYSVNYLKQWEVDYTKRIWIFIHNSR